MATALDSCYGFDYKMGDFPVQEPQRISGVVLVPSEQLSSHYLLDQPSPKQFSPTDTNDQDHPFHSTVTFGIPLISSQPSFHQLEELRDLAKDGRMAGQSKEQEREHRPVSTKSSDFQLHDLRGNWEPEEERKLELADVCSSYQLGGIEAEREIKNVEKKTAELRGMLTTTKPSHYQLKSISAEEGQEEEETSPFEVNRLNVSRQKKLNSSLLPGEKQSQGQDMTEPSMSVHLFPDLRETQQLQFHSLSREPSRKLNHLVQQDEVEQEGRDAVSSYALVDLRDTEEEEEGVDAHGSAKKEEELHWATSFYAQDLLQNAEVAAH